MSMHPNAMLICILVTDDLSRKTARGIAGGKDCDEEGFWEIFTSENKYTDGYTMMVMEDSYDEDRQISAPVGSLVVYQYLTYGYGEQIEITEVETRVDNLRKWAARVCDEHHCTSRILISANYR